MEEKAGADRLLIGVDVGGTKIAAAGVDGQGNIAGRVHPARIQFLLGQRQDQTHHLAPEIPENRGLIVYASRQGAAVEVGHSAASY